MALFLTVIFLTLCVSILCLILEIQKRRIRTGVLMSFCVGIFRGKNSFSEAYQVI